MKLALIRRQFSATGGAELYLQRLLKALVEKGHEPHLFAEAWSEKPEGVTLHEIKITGTRAQKPVRFAEAVKTEVAKEKFDCVFSLERTLKQDVYRAGDGVHRVWLERRRQFAPWWKRPFIGRGAFHRNMLALESQTFHPANTRHIIVNSEMVRREILEHFKFPAERIHLVRNGVDVARFQSGKRAETRARFGVKDDEFLLLFVGSGWERKGLEFVLEAMVFFENTWLQRVDRWAARLYRRPSPMMTKMNPGKVKLLVVGKGDPPFRPRNVVYAGPMPDVENAYAAADLFVYLPIYEPSANVVFEAMAAGLPIVTTNFNGASEMIRPCENGTIADDPCQVFYVIGTISLWWEHPRCIVPIDSSHLSLERNVSETLAVLELAAKEKRS